MDKVQKPNSPECHIPSSEPFKVYILACRIKPTGGPASTALRSINVVRVPSNVGIMSVSQISKIKRKLPSSVCNIRRIWTMDCIQN
jgi:hypothetical protein